MPRWTCPHGQFCCGGNEDENAKSPAFQRGSDDRKRARLGLGTLFEFCEHLFGESLEGIEDAGALWSDRLVLGYAGGI